MVAGSIPEIASLFWEGCVSVDSSCAVWRGLHEHVLDDEQDQKAWSDGGRPVDFNWRGEVTPEARLAIKYNMNLILRTLNQKEMR
jgi:hypothetical protein